MKAAHEDVPRAAVEGAAALAARNVTKLWSGRAIIDGLELSLPRGSVTWLGGRNGSGKTTLLRVLAGVIDPDTGEIRMEGLDPFRDRREYQRHLGFLPAGNGALYARLTVMDNLEFWAGLAMLPRRGRGERVEATLEEFELAPLARSRVDRLSMGQRQRVRIAMAFLHAPEVVLMDEPQTSLDDDALRLLDRALRQLVDRSGCALWCSPARHGIDLSADRAFVLRDGRLAQA
jgi:ABC-type multidrug transport system ATPase subunit